MVWIYAVVWVAVSAWFGIRHIIKGRAELIRRGEFYSYMNDVEFTAFVVFVFWPVALPGMYVMRHWIPRFNAWLTKRAEIELIPERTAQALLNKGKK